MLPTCGSAPQGLHRRECPYPLNKHVKDKQCRYHTAECQEWPYASSQILAGCLLDTSAHDKAPAPPAKSVSSIPLARAGRQWEAIPES